MKNALIVYLAPAFLVNVLISREIFMSIKLQVKFQHYFPPDFQIGHVTVICSQMSLVIYLYVCNYRGEGA